MARGPRLLVLELLRRLCDPGDRAGDRAGGLALVLITHDARVAAAVANEVLVLVDGRVATAGPTDAVLPGPDPAGALVARLRDKVPGKPVEQNAG
jgi:ABC-type microcin C transport system duplicated ATPase subunit YejF